MRTDDTVQLPYYYEGHLKARADVILKKADKDAVVDLAVQAYRDGFRQARQELRAALGLVDPDAT